MKNRDIRLSVFERVIWNLVWNVVIRPFPRRMALKWEIPILNLLGAKIHPTAHIYSSTKIWLPRNLQMDEYSILADHVEVFNVSKVHLKAHSCVSQHSILSSGSRSLNNDSFERISEPIIIEENSWIAAHCLVLNGSRIGRESVVGAGSVIRSVIPPYAIVIGNPPMVVGFRYTLEEMINKEQNVYGDCSAIPAEVLEKNNQKYFLGRLDEIKKFTGL